MAGEGPRSTSSLPAQKEDVDRRPLPAMTLVERPLRHLEHLFRSGS